MDHFLHTHSSCNMQVAVDHTIAGSQAISGRTPLFSHTPGTCNQSWVSTQPASRATPLVEAPPTQQQQLAFPQRHFSADAIESIFHYLNNSTHNLAPPTSASSLSDVFQPSNPLPDSQDRS